MKQNLVEMFDIITRLGEEKSGVCEVGGGFRRGVVVSLCDNAIICRGLLCPFISVYTEINNTTATKITTTM